jgi:lipopolysaccharide transport system permease protein
MSAPPVPEVVDARAWPAPRRRADVTAKIARLAPAGRWPRIDLEELWAYRGLFRFLVWRDIKVRYAQTILGAAWAILQPVMTMVVFSLIFGKLARMPTDGAPYPVFSLAALVPWTYFSTGLNAASNSLLANQNLITKIYLPRLVIPYASVLGALMDFGIGFMVLLAILLGYGIVPSAAALVAVPLLLGTAILAAAGLGCWLAALNIQYRDVKYVVPFLDKFLMYASPVVYPLSLVPEAYRPLVALNPMVGVIAGFRAVLLHQGPMPWPTIATSASSAVGLFLAGSFYFRSVERKFADIA